MAIQKIVYDCGLQINHGIKINHYWQNHSKWKCSLHTHLTHYNISMWSHLSCQKSIVMSRGKICWSIKWFVSPVPWWADFYSYCFLVSTSYLLCAPYEETALLCSTVSRRHVLICLQSIMHVEIRVFHTQGLKILSRNQRCPSFWHFNSCTYMLVVLRFTMRLHFGCISGQGNSLSWH